MKKETLANISKLIFTGATKKIFTWQSKLDFSTKVHVIQGHSITSFGEVDRNDLEIGYIAQGNTGQRQLLQHGDVLVLARGSDMRAALFTTTSDATSCIATSNFIIIRPDTEKILSEVIVTFLNSPQGIFQLKQASQGAAIESITLNKLKALTIPIPSRVLQVKIRDLFEARNQAYKATINYAKQQFVTVSAQLENLFIGEEDGNN